MAPAMRYKYVVVAMCIALVAASSAAALKLKCDVPTEIANCVQEFARNKGALDGNIFSDDCCNKLAAQTGCGCIIRDKLIEFGVFDIQKSFCLDGTGCDTLS